MSRRSSTVVLVVSTVTVLLCIPRLSLCDDEQLCKNPPIIFNFGDSNSDTGGLVSGLGFPVKLPNGRSFFRRSTGRLCDGRLVIDFLCQSLNTNLLSPYLDSIDSNFSNGANFAIVGSKTLPENVPFALNIQIMQFTHFKARSIELASSGFRNLVDSEGFSEALYIIDIGQNDIADSFATGLSYAQVVKKIPSILVEIEKAVKAIYDQGGRRFWVHNTGPLGCLPQKLAMLNNTPPQNLDSYGCISHYNDATKLFNEGLRRLCQELRSSLTEATVVYVDIYSIKSDLIVNSTNYGFSSPLTPCCGGGGPPYNYDQRVACGYPGCDVCDESAHFVSWDGVHYTEAANSFISAKIISMDYSTPKVPFSFFCQ